MIYKDDRFSHDMDAKVSFSLHFDSEISIGKRGSNNAKSSEKTTAVFLSWNPFQSGREHSLISACRTFWCSVSIL